MKFTEFKEFAVTMSSQGNLAMNRYVTTLSEFVQDEENTSIYPQNLLMPDKQVKFFVFTRTKMIIFDVGRELVALQSRNLDDIVKIDFSKVAYDVAAKMEIEFTSGDKVSFNSQEDANVNWSSQFAKYINEIFKTLSAR